MNKFYFTFFVIIAGLCLSSTATAQRVSGSVTGKLVDTMYRETLADATVSVLEPTDSTVVSYTLADSKGEFTIKGLDAGRYRLMISFQGYRNYNNYITISAEKQAIDMGTINMVKQDDMLEEVIVERPPITIKEDTVEFSAAAFKTKPNATAEDLLKKLPGFEVDKDGNVKAQGESIPKVYVNGKEFFGDDPKLATKNITADMIESIQLYDDMSDQAKFTRIDDGSRQKTINIKIKKGMDKGSFGRLIVGGGSDSHDPRYESSLMYNYFYGDRRISLLAGINNINKQNFSFRDVVSSMGGFGSGGSGGGNRSFGQGFLSGGGSGISRSLSSGLNYVDKWGSKVDVTASYFYSNTNNHTEQTGLQQRTYSKTDEASGTAYDSLANSNESSISDSKNQNHRINMRLEYYIDSNNSILYSPSVTFQNSSTMSEDTIYTFSSLPFNHTSSVDSMFLRLTGISRSSTERTGMNMNNNLLYRRRFGKTGRTFTLGVNSTIGKSDGSGTSYSPVTYYQPGGTVDSVGNQDLENKQVTHTNNIVVTSSYTEPLGANKLMEFNYAYTDNHNTSDKNAFNYNEQSGKYDLINTGQTNSFENDFVAHRAGTNFRMQGNKYSFQLGGAVQFSEMTSRSIRASQNYKDTTISANYTNFFPTASFDYNISRTNRLRVRYRGRTSQPSINQLQDVPDSSNQLRITIGNPNLKQEFANTINLNYHAFNASTYRYVGFSINYSGTSNKIVNSITNDAKSGAQTVVPVNVDGVYNASTDLNLGFPLRGNMKGSSINLGTNASVSRNSSLIDGQENVLKGFSLSQRAGINLDFHDVLNLGLNANVSYTSSRSSLQAAQNTNYFSQTYSLDASYTFLKTFIVSSDFDYTLNTGRSAGYNQTLPLWNGSLAKQLFKKQNGELKFSVRDILNQNTSVNRSVSDNYILDTRTLVLKRYFMLTFTYNLNKMGGNRRGMDGPPGGFDRRMFRGGGGGGGMRGGGGMDMDVD